MKKIFAMFLASALLIVALAIPASAAYDYGNHDPYVRSWLDAINDFVVVDYYQYSSTENAYVKAATLNYNGSNAYYKTVDTVLTTELYDEAIGFDRSGCIYFIDAKYNLLGCGKNSKNVSSLGTTATDLVFDDSGFVIGYYFNGYSYPLGSNNNNNNSGPTWNDIWGNSGSNWNDNSNVKYPYITIEDDKLTYCESSDKHHSLYIDDGCLVMNNIILYRNGVKSYGFTQNGVAWITKNDRLCTYTFGEKKHHLKKTKVSDLIFDSTGSFIIGYKRNGQIYYL